MMKIYDHNKTSDYEEYLKKKNNETAPTYESLEMQKKTIEEKYEKEIKDLKLLGTLLTKAVTTIIDETMLEVIKNKSPAEEYELLCQFLEHHNNWVKEKK